MFTIGTRVMAPYFCDGFQGRKIGTIDEAPPSVYLPSDFLPIKFDDGTDGWAYAHEMTIA